MPVSYLITGASRGIGAGFLKQLSRDPNNLIIGLVRDKVATDKKVAQELGDLPNVHIVQGDITNYEELELAVKEVSRITEGTLDYIIANAGVAGRTGNLPINILAEKREDLEKDFFYTFNTNVIGNANVINLFLPFVLKGKTKKVIAISSAHGDLDLIRDLGIEVSAPYAVSKAALNCLITMYDAHYRPEGVLFLAICPGFVDTGVLDNVSEEEKPYVEKLVASFSKHSPNPKKQSPEEAVNNVMSVVQKASIDNGDGGMFLSHLGSRTQWL
ncbi:short-chain dehydrogenase [Durotheca rogersii]|uniref:short-chain dehydrogenase n=1 Tax=Durotheca rogersii TaxID=419775 RepID=UPI002220B1CB|nr:short-chain dehydrogenase [Durotheca rogersii]KAI5868243.1 short-chain dehydrogenase [Durotheca rogersii]